MATLSSWLWGTSSIDDAVDKATSELQPTGTENIALNLEISDQIRSKSVSAKDAMKALKRRLNHKNPNVQLLALGVTDTCIKNGGDHFLVEIASREFMDNLASILKIPALNLDVKNTILRLVQNWSIAFEGKPMLSYVGQTYKTLLNEGFTFPPKDPIVSTSAMVDTKTAPEWIDSELCMRCRDSFTFTNRKHHCRNCGLVFDQKCSSQSIPLPHYGIAQDVRVCDSCYSKIHKRAEKAHKGHRHSASMHGGRTRAARDFADADLQRAIQLSLQETGLDSRPAYAPPSSSVHYQSSEPPLIDRSTQPATAEEDDPELKAAIEASLREANAPRPSAPLAMETAQAQEAQYAGPGYSQSYPPGNISSQPSLPRIPNHDLEPLESDVILTFSQTVDQVHDQGGKDLTRYPAVSELYDKANSLRPKLAMSLDDAGKKEEMLTEMHEKLSQAVKLYDQLLTEQLSQPRWRSPHAYQQQAYQQPQQVYAQPQQTYSPPQQAHAQQQQSYAAPYQPQSIPIPNGYSSWGPAEQQTPFSSTSAAPSPPQQYHHFSPPAAEMAPTSPPISHQAYNSYQPEPQASYQAPPAPVSVQPSAFAPASVSSAPPPIQSPPTPVHYAPVQSPPPPQQFQYQVPSRQNSLPAEQQYQQPYRHPAPALPQFPAAPTAVPHTWAAPSREEPRIQKEALLIDL